MKRLENNFRNTSRFTQPLFFGVVNLLMVVMVGKGMIHLNNGASAGYLELLLGTLGLICAPWIQNKMRDVNPNWPIPLYWIFFMGLFGIYAFFGMVKTVI